MAADAHLGAQFFHGSHEEFEPGYTIEPYSAGYKDEQAWRGDRVWMSGQPDHAEEWSPGGHVYRVQPTDVKAHDPDDWDYEANVSAGAALRQYHAASAKVLGRAAWDPNTRKYKDI